jgi:hypothetical protein
MELYLMGLAAPSEVGSYFILNNQNQTVSVGQTLASTDITQVSLSQVTTPLGARSPDTSTSQKTFRCATIVISESLLDQYAMSFYDYFARRCEAKQQLTYADGLATGACNPWYLATGMRSIMFSKIVNDIPAITLTPQSGGGGTLSFTGKIGVSYQRESSPDLKVWTAEDAAVTVTSPNSPWQAPVNVNLPAPTGTQSKFYRFRVNY